MDGGICKRFNHRAGSSDRVEGYSTTRLDANVAPHRQTLEHEEVAMDWKDHTYQVGGIVTNLQALEAVLRYFLLRLERQQLQFPKPGDADAGPRKLLRAMMSSRPC